jgi:hypothetical protein
MPKDGGEKSPNFEFKTADGGPKN